MATTAQRTTEEGDDNNDETQSHPIDGMGSRAAVLPRVVRAQAGDGGLTARIARDLERHAPFGHKLSGGTGDVQTAEWIAIIMATDTARAAVASPASRIRRRSGRRRASSRPSPDLGFTNAFAVIDLHSGLHTIEDTLERTDARLVAPVVTAHRRALERLAAA